MQNGCTRSTQGESPSLRPCPRRRYGLFCHSQSRTNRPKWLQFCFVRGQNGGQFARHDAASSGKKNSRVVSHLGLSGLVRQPILWIAALKYYRLTPAVRKQLAAQESNSKRMAVAISPVTS